MSELSNFLGVYNAMIGTVSVIQQANIAKELREQKRNELRYQLERARAQHQLDRILVNNPQGNRVILLETVVARDIETVDMLLSQFHANPNVKDVNGNTALHTAASYGDYYIAKLLIQYGADINSTNTQGNTPIHVAAMHGATNIVNLLLGNGSDVNQCNSNGETPLFIAVKNNNYTMANSLIRYGADINVQDSNGNSPLHVAAIRYNSGMLKLLVKFNADVNIENNNGRTPLHLAVTSNRPSNIKALLSSKSHNINVDVQDNSGRTALHYAVAQFDIAKILVNYGADVNVRDNNGDTPLHIATTYNRKDSIKLLLSRSSIVNASNNKGESPIHLAIRTRNTEIVKLLLQSGASLLDETVDHDIALFIPIKHSDYHMVKNLVHLFYVNVNTGNSMGVTPLHLAIETGNLMMIKLLIELGANVDIRCTNGSTPIHYAVSRGNYLATKLLLKYGANVNVQDQDGNTPLHIAVNSNFTNIAQLLRQNGANIYIEDMNHIRSHDLHSSLPSSNNTDAIEEGAHNKSCTVPNRGAVAYNHDINTVQVDSAMSTSLKQHCTIDTNLMSFYTYCNNKRKNIVSEQQSQSINHNMQFLSYQNRNMLDLNHRAVHQMTDHSLLSISINLLMVIVSVFK